MKELKLQNSHKTAIVDDEDFDRLSKLKWYLQVKGSINRNLLYGRHISLASEIMRQPKIMFDHIDRNPLNNSKSNLRQCSYSQNSINRVKMNGTSSKYKGVSYHKPLGKWRARGNFNNYEVSLGYFNNEEAAASAYNKFVIERFKEFAVLNKNEKGEIL